jgi:hypothetical protein
MTEADELVKRIDADAIKNMEEEHRSAGRKTCSTFEKDQISRLRTKSEKKGCI